MNNPPFANSEQLADLDAFRDKWGWLCPGVDIRHSWAPLEGNVAECEVSIALGNLLIRIRNADEKPEHYDEFGLERDVEADYVHELLHWRFAPFMPKRGTVAYEFWEAAVERTAQDLIRMDRVKKDNGA